MGRRDIGRTVMTAISFDTGATQVSSSTLARLAREIMDKLPHDELARELGGEAALRASGPTRQTSSYEEAWRILRVAYQRQLFDIVQETGLPPVSFDIQRGIDLLGKPIGFDQEIPPVPLIKRPTKIGGLPVDFPLGLPASVLATNANWLEFYGKRGFDILTYKTVRSREHKGWPWPNWVFIENPRDLAQESDTPFIGMPGYFPEDLAKVSMANSFGIPSLAPDAWEEDVRRARAIVKEGHQVLIVSVFASKTESEDAIIQDFVATALSAKKAGADIIEANYSCPNVPNEGDRGDLFKDAERSARVSSAIRDAIHPTPFFVKIGYLPEHELREFVNRNAAFIDGIVAINAISERVNRSDKTPTFPGRDKAGISGWSIKSRAHEVARNLVALQKDVHLNYNKRLTLLSIGGVITKQDFDDRLAIGVDGVESCTGAYLNPYLGFEIRFDQTAGDRLLRALSSPKFEWRTIRGLTKETGLSAKQVEVLMGRLSDNDKIVKSSNVSSEGLALFTSREHFRQKGSIFEKVLGVLHNRAT
jgi:dihydroorotate dehydrogenase (NAD+) catalytic subunit